MKEFKFRDMTLTASSAIKFLERHPSAAEVYERDYEVEGCVRCLIASYKELQEEVEKLRSELTNLETQYDLLNDSIGLLAADQE